MIKQEEIPKKQSEKISNRKQLLCDYLESAIHDSVEKFSVELIEFGGLGAALKALRLPFGKESRSASSFSKTSFTPAVYDGSDDWYDGLKYENVVLLSEKDRNLLSTLIKRGDEHAKVLRGVVVWCMINAPRYWWQEMDTYRVGAERLASESTMHIQGKGLSEDELVEMKELLPEGTMQKRIEMFSYQTLRRIYFQRKDHRLPQWMRFCDWIKTLPFAEEFITIERDNHTDK